MTIWSIIQQHSIKVSPDKYDTVILRPVNASRGISKLAQAAAKSIAFVESNVRKRRNRSVVNRDGFIAHRIVGKREWDDEPHLQMVLELIDD